MPGYARPVNYYATGVSFTPAGNVSATTVQAAVEEVDSEKIPTSVVDAKGDLIVGTADNAVARLAAGTNGYVLTTDSSTATGVKWAMGTAGATGGGTDQVFYNNDQVVTTNYSIPSGKNSLTAGPVTINSGVTVTIPTGSVWVIL